MQKIYNIGLIPHRKELTERAMLPFSQVNYLMNGACMDRVTLITSGSDNGKTTVTSQIICDIIKQGYKCCCFFGEDTAYESQDRIFKQSLKADETGGIYYQPYIVNGKETNCGEYILDDATWQKAYERFNDKLFLYNTKASARVEDILDGFEEARTKYGCRVFVLDNCEQFDFATDNENIELKNSVIKIRDYAINNKVHIFLVHHIRKMPRDVILPDMNDIKGTGSLVNISKNVIIIVRMDKIDHSTKEYKSLKSLLELNNYNLDEADCLVHVAKTKGRKIGFACLKFNKKLGIYYDCKKIDEAKEETDKVEVVAPQFTQQLLDSSMQFTLSEDQDPIFD